MQKVRNDRLSTFCQTSFCPFARPPFHYGSKKQLFPFFLFRFVRFSPPFSLELLFIFLLWMQGVRHVERLSTKEAQLGLAAGADQHGSWHDEYRGSAYIFVGGVARGLNEGDLVAVFSQYGRVVRVNLVRDRATGESRGYAFLCYEDERSTILAVDNFNGITLAGRVIQFVPHPDHNKPLFCASVSHVCVHVTQSKSCEAI